VQDQGGNRSTITTLRERYFVKSKYAYLQRLYGVIYQLAFSHYYFHRKSNGGPFEYEADASFGVLAY
jgi:hypothetical protein